MHNINNNPGKGLSLVERVKNIYWKKPLILLGSAVALTFLAGCNPINYKVAFHPNGDKMAMGMMQYEDNGVPNVAYTIFIEDKFGGMNKSDIYMMDIDGKDLINITKTKDIGELWPSFSPDGNWISYYASMGEDSESGIFMKSVEYDKKVDEYTFGEEKLTIKNGMFAEFSPDGKYISSTGGNSVLIYNIEKKGLSEVNLEGSIYWAGWSPDGKKLAAVTDTEGLDDIPSVIYVFNKDGTDIKRITKDKTINFWPEWDKDSKHIYFTSNMRDKTPDRMEMIENYESSFSAFKAKYREGNLDEKIKNENFHIYRINIENMQLEFLTPHLGRGDIMDICPELSPNGKTLAYVERKESIDNIWLMDRNGENRRMLTNNTFENLGPIWWTPKGDRLVCVSARGIYAVDSKTGNLEKITGYVESQARFIEMASFFEDKFLEYVSKEEFSKAIADITGLIKLNSEKYNKLKADFDKFKNRVGGKVDILWKDYQKR